MRSFADKQHHLSHNAISSYPRFPTRQPSSIPVLASIGFLNIALNFSSLSRNLAQGGRADGGDRAQNV